MMASMMDSIYNAICDIPMLDAHTRYMGGWIWWQQTKMLVFFPTHTAWNGPMPKQ